MCGCQQAPEPALVLGSIAASMLSSAQIIKAEMVLWTAGFVLLTLVINAP